jgi:MFS family permease
LITTRIITGACSGVLGNVTSGIVSDIWKSGRSMSFSTSLYIWALLAGLSMGPVFGSLVVHYTTWRWYVRALLSLTTFANIDLGFSSPRSSSIVHFCLSYIFFFLKSDRKSFSPTASKVSVLADGRTRLPTSQNQTRTLKP